MTSLLRRLNAEQIPSFRRKPLDAVTLTEATAIVEDVRSRGELAIREHAERLGDINRGEQLLIGKPILQEALERIDVKDRDLLRRTAERIRAFATAQLKSLSPMSCPVPGGEAGHSIAPVERAGCYAPGGRYPLPSSVLMTAVTARVAGVKEVWLASPRPPLITKAAAAIADVDGMLTVGGAQAVAALAYGTEQTPPCDVIVGPGNQWVTAAKQIVSGIVRIDQLAGPSELVVLADDSADARLVAADLLAQAEHDDDAWPVLVTTNEQLLEEVESELKRQLADLATSETAGKALNNGFAVVVDDLQSAVTICNQLAPEHLQIATRNPSGVAKDLRHYGALFIGQKSAEVFGDYGIGPNHVLPTGGSARSEGGLSVLTFLRIRTWLRIVDISIDANLKTDIAHLAELEGLEAHRSSIEYR